MIRSYLSNNNESFSHFYLFSEICIDLLKILAPNLYLNLVFLFKRLEIYNLRKSKPKLCVNAYPPPKRGLKSIKCNLPFLSKIKSQSKLPTCLKILEIFLEKLKKDLEFSSLAISVSPNLMLNFFFLCKIYSKNFHLRH